MRVREERRAITYRDGALDAALDAIKYLMTAREVVATIDEVLNEYEVPNAILQNSQLLAEAQGYY